MGNDDNNGDIGFQQSGGGSILNCASSGMDTNSMSDKVAGMAMCSESMFKSSTGVVDPFYGSGCWDPIVSLNHGENFGATTVVPHHNEFGNSHYQVALQNQPISSSSHLVHYQSDSGLGDMVTKIPSFGSGAFSEMVNSFGLPAECAQTTETSFNPNYAQRGGAASPISEDRVLGNSQTGKKKRKASDAHSPLNPKKNVEVEQHKDLSGNSSDCSKEQEELKNKMEQSNSTNLRNKQAGKQIKENSISGEPSKETYIHVRAKRGQATNSHSLAERVRRERISERMRLLQELVPGCNKITGKAVMLDEIINYVQSLQQQVEFLSMKLATVNPELNIDLERIFSKDILHSRGSNAGSLGIGPGMNPSHAFAGYPQGPFPGIPGATPPFHSLPQAVWDNELQNILQMGFDSNPSINNLGPNGPSKLEL